jgi:hypothetical protein
MRDTTEEDEALHWATVLSPGEVFRSPYIHLKNDSNTFDMYVQCVDELQHKIYRSFTYGEGWRIYRIPEGDEIG